MDEFDRLTLEQIAEGNFDIEVPRSPHNEIAALGRALETAVDRIRERDQHLRRLANFDMLTSLPVNVDPDLFPIKQSRDFDPIFVCLEVVQKWRTFDTPKPL